MIAGSPYFLFLDDCRSPREVTWVRLPNVTWTIVRNYASFTQEITKRGYLPSHISFDHDLADEHYADANEGMRRMLAGQKAYVSPTAFKEKTGYDCALWVVDWCMDHKVPLPEYTVHSQNPIGKERIEGLLRNFAGHLVI